MQIRSNIAVSENGFVFNPSTGDSYSVNPVGQEILAMLRVGASEEGIITQILETYHVERTVVEKDLGDFFHLLTKHKIAQ